MREEVDGDTETDLGKLQLILLEREKKVVLLM